MEPIPNNPRILNFYYDDLKEKYDDHIAEARISKWTGRVLMAASVITAAAIEATANLTAEERLGVAAVGLGVGAVFGLVFGHGRRLAEGQANVDRILARTTAQLNKEELPDWAN